LAFLVRRATEHDLGGILECLRAAFEPYRLSYTPAAFHDTVPPLDALRERLAAMVVLVAVSSNGGVAGTVAGTMRDSTDGHLRGMAVDPVWQGSGVADELLAAIEKELRVSGCARVTLDTTEPLQKAVRFYTKHGYTPSGRVADFFGMPLYEYVKPLVQER
jgi:N-acetylglutamate synthase-like GNAT family acetyltransferase